MADLDLKITADPSDFSLGPDNVVAITNPSLLNALVQQSSETIAFLSKISPLALTSISVDDEGRVVVADAAFAAAVRTTVKADMLTNAVNVGICANGSCRSL